MKLLFWHPIFGRLRVWFGLGAPTGRPAVFLGLIDAAPVFLGHVDAALSLGILAPVPALGPAFLGLMDGNLPLGIVNAVAAKLGVMQAAAMRLGKMPVRRGS